MIINKNTSNVIVVTLKEKQTSANPDWLLELTNDIENDPKYLSITDISNYPDRYNEFVIDEPGDIELAPTGQWTYRFLEMAPTSPIDTDPLNALAVCETGICIVIDSTENPIVNFDTDDNVPNKTFDV